MHLLYALVRKSSFNKVQGFMKPAPVCKLNDPHTERVHVCVRAYVRACVRVCERACRRVGVRACGCAGVWVCGRADVREGGRACARADVRACGCAGVHAFMRVYMFACSAFVRDYVHIMCTKLYIHNIDHADNN